jgi:hypothetical protein
VYRSEPTRTQHTPRPAAPHFTSPARTEVCVCVCDVVYTLISFISHMLTLHATCIHLCVHTHTHTHSNEDGLVLSSPVIDGYFADVRMYECMSAIVCVCHTPHPQMPMAPINTNIYDTHTHTHSPSLTRMGSPRALSRRLQCSLPPRPHTRAHSLSKTCH